MPPVPQDQSCIISADLKNYEPERSETVTMLLNPKAGMRRVTNTPRRFGSDRVRLTSSGETQKAETKSTAAYKNASMNQIFR
jgi:hypothetical protein